MPANVKPKNSSYGAVVETLKKRLGSGELAVGQKLPSERSLAEELDVNRRTLRRALDLLQREGLLEPSGARGSRVAANSILRAPVGFCLDTSLPDTDQVIQVSNEPVLIARGMMRRFTSEPVSRTLAWCSQSEPLFWEQMTSADPQLSGLMIWPTLPASPDLAERLRNVRQAMPLVLLDRRIPGLESDFVGFDDRAVGRMMAEHLLRLGHRRFAFFGWSVPETVHDRLLGAEDVIERAGGELDSSWVFLTKEDGAAASHFEDFLARDNKPTAILCANDLIAIALIVKLQAQGYTVPADFAVVGAGNSIDNILDAVGLTTVALPNEDVGWEAADLLLSRLRDNPSQEVSVCERRLTVRLVIRRSCGSTSSRTPTP
jgi:GntR family transcriptional regulator, arabinose operon transcriptional repressor